MSGAAPTSVTVPGGAPFLVRMFLIFLILGLLALQITRFAFAARFAPDDIPTASDKNPDGSTRSAEEIAAENDRLRNEAIDKWQPQSAMDADLVLAYLIPFLLLFGVSIVCAFSPSTTRASWTFGALPALGLLALNVTQTRYLDVGGAPRKDTPEGRAEVLQLMERGRGLVGKRLIGELALHVPPLIVIGIYILRNNARIKAAQLAALQAANLASQRAQAYTAQQLAAQ